MVPNLNVRAGKSICHPVNFTVYRNKRPRGDASHTNESSMGPGMPGHTVCGSPNVASSAEHTLVDHGHVQHRQYDVDPRDDEAGWEGLALGRLAPRVLGVRAQVRAHGWAFVCRYGRGFEHINSTSVR